jgi:hypothetical protein
MNGLCRNCGKSRINRPRGLCWRCYYEPGAKTIYGRLAHYGLGLGNCGRQLPATHTYARPGTAEKIAVLADRAASDCALWHPLDAPMDEPAKGGTGTHG